MEEEEKKEEVDFSKPLTVYTFRNNSLFFFSFYHILSDDTRLQTMRIKFVLNNQMDEIAAAVAVSGNRRAPPRERERDL